MPLFAASRASRHTRAAGFSMIELMVTLTVAAIFLGIGIPSFANFTSGQKVKTVSGDLMNSLVLARSEAIKRNSDVTIAPDTAGVWLGGWTVKVGATTLQQQQPLTGVTITNAAATIVYKPSGRPSAPSNFQVTGSASVRCVKVDPSGIPSTQTVACP